MVRSLARDVLLAVAAVVFLVSFGAIAVGADLRVQPLPTLAGAAVPPVLALTRLRAPLPWVEGLGTWPADSADRWSLLAAVLGANLFAQVLVFFLPRAAVAGLVWLVIGAAAGTLGIVVGLVGWRRVERETRVL